MCFFFEIKKNNENQIFFFLDKSLKKILKAILNSQKNFFKFPNFLKFKTFYSN